MSSLGAHIVAEILYVEHDESCDTARSTRSGHNAPMRADAQQNQILRAVVKAIEATFDRSRWLELALATNTLDRVRGHPRLLRSLEWGDADYSACVIEIAPLVLGERKTLTNAPGDLPNARSESFPNLQIVEDFLNLRGWLRKHEPELYRDLYAGEDEAPLDELQSAAAELGVPDIDEHAVRIRRGLRDDPAQAIGSSKELLETVLKAVLGLHGAGPEAKIDMPELVKKANISLGLDPAGVRNEDPGAKQRRQLLGSLSHIVNSAAELRNAGFGTGHGHSRRVALDVATARLVVSAAVAAATFYVETYVASQADCD
jgi:AbiJ N-terminal domain 5/Abortive infection C-terminus